MKLACLRGSESKGASEMPAEKEDPNGVVLGLSVRECRGRECLGNKCIERKRMNSYPEYIESVVHGMYRWILLK